MNYSLNPQFSTLSFSVGTLPHKVEMPELPPPDMSRPPVSFIIPIHSRSSQYLPTALDSVLTVAQNYGPAELLLYDDKSPDDSYEVMKQYRERYPKLIRLFRGETNLGIARARQKLVDASEAEYIISFDQDDIMLNFNLAAAVGVLEKEHHYAASYAPKRLFNKKGLLDEIHGAEFSRFGAFFAPRVNVNAMILRRSELLAHGSFEVFNDQPFSPIDDVYLFTRLARDRDLHFDPTPRCMWRRHESQFSNNDDSDEKFKIMAGKTVALYPEIYQAIRELKIPECTPENFRVVQGLVGVAVYLNQNDKNYILRLFELALEKWPEDYGIWEHYLRVLGGCNKFLELRRAAAAARRRFSDKGYPMITFLMTELTACNHFTGGVPDDLLQDYQSRCRRYLAVHPLVADAVRRYCDFKLS